MLLPEAPDNFDVGMFMASTQLSYEDSRNASHLISGAYSERPSCTLSSLFPPFLCFLPLQDIDQ